MSVLMKVGGVESVQAKYDRMNKRAPAELINAMRRTGTAKARAIKGAIKGSKTGLLAKSIGNKTKALRNGVIYDVAGARRGFRTTVQEVEKKKLRGTRVDPKQGEKKVVLKRARGVKKGDVLSPTRYEHLADKDGKTGKGATRTGQHFMEEADAATQPVAIAEVGGALDRIVQA